MKWQECFGAHYCLAANLTTFARTGLDPIIWAPVDHRLDDHLLAEWSFGNLDEICKEMVAKREKLSSCERNQKQFATRSLCGLNRKITFAIYLFKFYFSNCTCSFVGNLMKFELNTKQCDELTLGDDDTITVVRKWGICSRGNFCT